MKPCQSVFVTNNINSGLRESRGNAVDKKTVRDESIIIKHYGLIKEQNRVE